MLFEGREECDGIFARIVEIHIWWRRCAARSLRLQITGAILGTRGAFRASG